MDPNAQSAGQSYQDTAPRRGPARFGLRRARSAVAGLALRSSAPALIAMGLLGIAFLLAVPWQTWHWTQRHVEQTADAQARLALEFNRVLRNYVGANIRPRMEQLVGPGEFIPEAMSTSFVARSVFDGVRDQFPNYLLRFPSTNPRNPVNLATEREQEVIRYFIENPKATSWSGTIHHLGSEYVARALPRRFDQACIRCHGRPEAAPADITARYGTTAGFGRAPEDVSIDLVGIPVADIKAGARNEIRRNTVGAAGLCGAFLLTIAAVIYLDAMRRRSAQTALRESESQYRGLFENSISGVAIHQIVLNEHGQPIDYTYEQVNAAFEEHTGLRAANVVGRRATAVIPGVTTAPFLGVYAQVAKTGHPVVFDSYFEPLKRHFHINAYQLGPGRFASVFQDVSASKRVEHDLRKLSHAVEQTPASVVITDVGGNIEYVNPAFVRTTGYTAEEAVGKNPRVLKSGLMPAETYREMWRELTAGRDWRGELQNRRKDGELFWELAVISPLRDCDGNTTHYLAIKENITERRRADEALRTSQQILEGIISAIPWRVFWKDDKLVYLGCNPPFARDAGCADPKEVIGKDDYQMGWRAQADLYRSDDRLVIESGCPKLFIEEPQTTPEGNTITLLTSKIPLRGPNGEITGVLGTYIDITERKQAERALRAEQDNLRAIFAASPVGMLLIDESTMIVDSNSVIARIVSRGPDQINRQRGGGGLGCVHSLEDERGCGFAAACQNCSLRQGITQVLKTGTSVHGAEIQATLLIDGQEARPWLSVSAEPVSLNGRKHVLVAIDDITVRKAMEDELRAAARTDRLTGLPNRALLCDRLQQAVLRSKRLDDYHFAVLFLDFDRFKIINDSLGHEVGDQLLQEISHRLRSAVRSGDSLHRHAQEHTTARLGGDEFVVLLDGIASPADATMVANRLLEAFARPFQLGDHKVYSTASIGIVTSDMPADSAEDVLRDADTAMYEAKLAGKGQYVVFDVSMRQRVQDRLHLENDLRKALEANQLFLMYQPIISLQTGEIESVEALLRWNHPARGQIAPGEFIPIAEDTGLILPIGEWVLREACGQFAAWRARMGAAAPRSISVNLSRNQLVLPDLPKTIKHILAQTGVAPDCLQLEVTESAVMKDGAAGKRMLHAIKAVGVKLAMDDFGTGYSSLACLHDFPFDVLKIDRSFVANIDRGRDFAALVHAVTQLARNLNISVVAEGIETADQALVLQSLECEFGQGYLFSRPLMAEMVPGFLASPGALPGQSSGDPIGADAQARLAS